MRILIGLIFIVLGVLMMKYTFKVTQFTGTVDFAQKYLKNPGAGTYSWWRLIGLGFIILGVLWMSGILEFGPVTTILRMGN